MLISWTENLSYLYQKIIWRVIFESQSILLQFEFMILLQLQPFDFQNKHDVYISVFSE